MKSSKAPPEERLASSSLVGRYRILGELGRGGMGTVYRAEDTRLSRQVAIKVVPEEFAHAPKRLARFEREAKLLAALSHPNIATIHGIEESGGRRFLVLELLEGQNLGDRLKRGPLPVDEALSTCRQIAEGLEAAHEKGIVHRDLKPGNVMLCPHGRVKLLDFGLAKGRVVDGTEVDNEATTITADMTEPGTILGTSPYMSPEQARGLPTDKRTDIWAFGCVLYECLTGRPAFEGKTVSDTLAKILNSEPVFARLPASTPMSIRTLLRRCLRKDPTDRLHDVADARIEIEEASSASSEAMTAVRRTPWGRIVAAAAVLLVVGFLVGTMTRGRQQVDNSARLLASVLELEPGYALDGGRDILELGWPSLKAMAVSRDGGFVVYCAAPESDMRARPHLFIRRMDELVATPIPGTEGGVAPFLSPDDRWVGFWADGKLKKVPIEGGITQELCNAAKSSASWGANQRIVFADDVSNGLSTVAASGGEPAVLTSPDTAHGEGFHRLPSYLPEDRGVLFTVLRRKMGGSVDLDPRVALLDTATGRRTYLLEDASDARYVPTGHVVFLRRGALWAIPFDVRALKTTGPAVPVTSDVIQALVPTSRNTTAGQYGLSDSGHLVFAPGGVPPPWVNSLAWVDRQGRDKPAGPRMRRHYLPRLSPDGTKIAYQTLYEDVRVWIYDLQRDMAYPLVSDGTTGSPVWTPDGTRIIYWKVLPDQSAGVFSGLVSGVESEEEMLVAAPPGRFYKPTSVSPDGKTLALVGYEHGQPSHIYLYDFTTHSCARFATTPYAEKSPSFSPDGRWLLYSSDREGRHDVYVSPASGPGRPVMVSVDGGVEPGWARSGSWIFYRTYDQELPAAYLTRMWAVEIRPGPELSIGKPEALFESHQFGVSQENTCWDVSPDDQRFLMVKREDRPLQPVTELVLIQNWFEEIERLAPTKGR